MQGRVNSIQKKMKASHKIKKNQQFKKAKRKFKKHIKKINLHNIYN